MNENKEADPGGRRGAVTGGLGGAFIALAGPIGLGAVAVGAGVGAVAAVMRDSGFKNKDLEEVGSLMQDGRTLLLMAVSTRTTRDRLRSVLDDEPEFKAADRRWEATLGPDHQERPARGDRAVPRRSRPRRRTRPRPRPRAGRWAPSVGVGGQVVRVGPSPRSSGVVRSAPAGSCERTTRWGRGISMPLAWNAASSRLRNSPAAAHCSVARTRAEDLERHAVLAEGLDALDPRGLEDAPLPLRLAGHRPADVVDDVGWPGRCRCRRRRSRPG